MASWRVQPRLRQKVPVNVKLTDKELFGRLPIGDLWEDAGLKDAYLYMRSSKKCTIPDSWQGVFKDFDTQLGVSLPPELDPSMVCQ